MKQALLDKKIEMIINSNNEAIYDLYCKIYPDKITSDFTIDDIPIDELYIFVEEHFIEED